MVVVSEENLEKLNRSLRRIFSFPISRMTIREVQNALNDIFPGNQETVKAVYEALLFGEIKEPLMDDDTNEFSKFIDQYSPSVGIAREVAEAGEFLNTFTCDFLQQGNQVFFVNRMKRMDGQEYYFQSSPDTNIRLARLFVSRLRDLKIAIGGGTLNDKLKEELSAIINQIQELL